MTETIQSTEFDLDDSGCVMLTLATEVAGEGRYVLRSPAGAEYGHIKLLLSPFLGKRAYRFEWHVPEGTLPDFAKPATLEGVACALREELPGNCRVTRIRCAAIDGSYHDTDSTFQGFRLAAELAVRDALSRAKLVAM